MAGFILIMGWFLFDCGKTKKSSLLISSFINMKLLWEFWRFKEYGGFLAIRTNIVRVQLFELIDIIGKIWGQIYTANFFCSLIFNKWSLSNFALHVLIQCKTIPRRISRAAGSVRAGHQVDWYSWAESEDRSEHLLVGSTHTTFRELHCSK